MKLECYVCGEVQEVGDKCIKVICGNCIYDRAREKASNNYNPKRIKSECPKFEGCNAPLCILDEGIRDRAYLKGEPVCKLKPEELWQMLGKDLERKYIEFILVCLAKGARFVPWSKVRNGIPCEKGLQGAVFQRDIEAVIYYGGGRPSGKFKGSDGLNKKLVGVGSG